MEQLSRLSGGIIFWPVGTGDCTTVIVDGTTWLQIDMRHLEVAEDDEDNPLAVIDELVEIAPTVEGEPYLAAFTATHLDKDHICGFAEPLERFLIGELWFSPRVWWDARDSDSLSDDGKAFVEEVDRRIDEIRKRGVGMRSICPPVISRRWYYDAVARAGVRNGPWQPLESRSRTTPAITATAAC